MQKPRSPGDFSAYPFPWLGPGDVTHFSADHLYAARLRLDKKLNSKRCSSRDSAYCVVLGFSIFDPVRILRPRRSPIMHGHPSTHRRSGASIGLLLRQKVGNCKDNGYLKMAPRDSPSKAGIETNLSGLLTQVWSLTHLWQLVIVKPT